jgi:hypothetical protein
MSTAKDVIETLLDRDTLNQALEQEYSSAVPCP